MDENKRETDSALTPEYVLLRETASPIRGLAQVQREMTSSIFGDVPQLWLQFLDATEGQRTPARMRTDDIPGGPDAARRIKLPASLLSEGRLRGARDGARDRLRAYWLRAENCHGQINNDPVLPLRHQAVLVEYLLRDPQARRLLIADEVGLGKTIEVGLLLRGLLRDNPDLRVAYVTRGGLVENVANEFIQLGFTNFYLYANAELKGNAGQAILPVNNLLPDGRRFLISIHKLGHGDNWKAQRQLLGTSRFDVVIVDECHNLRAYGADEVSAQKFFRVIHELLRDYTDPNGRVYFLSGTPHQGNSEVFVNLAGLMLGLDTGATQAEKRAALRGKVVFRIKEDVRDWDDLPLFPTRDVRDVVSADAPTNYRRLLDDIGTYFDNAAASAGESSVRALGFVKSQALQYAASSPQAGFAYLLRRYARHFLSPASRGRVLGWIQQMLPYRDWEATAEAVLEAWTRAEASASERPEDVDGEAEGDDAEPKGGEEASLRRLLDDYAGVLRDPKARAKFDEVVRLVEGTDEAFVVFAQALETVYELKRSFEARDIPVWLIVGSQDAEQRADSIKRFRDGTGRRVLVSSSAGTEGINLQVSRQLVHFDLPWNPMVLEQRVGRVHRIGSLDTIIIHTVLLRGSREEDIYQRLGERLQEIVQALHDDPLERTKLYRRILTGIDVAELRRIFAGEASPDSLGSLVGASRDRVGQVDEELRTARANLGSEERGRATTQHLERLLTEREKVGPAGESIPYKTTEFDKSVGRLVQRVREVRRYVVNDGANRLVFDRTAAAMLRCTREETGGLGNNVVDGWLRELTRVAEEEAYASRSVAWVKSADLENLRNVVPAPGYVLFYLTGRIAAQEAQGKGMLRGLRMHAYALDDLGGPAVEIVGEAIEKLLWGVPWTPAAPSVGRADLVARDVELRARLSSLSAGEDARRTKVAVWPLAAIGYRP